MKTKDLIRIGVPAGRCADTAKQILQDAHAARRDMAAVTADLGRVAADPAAFIDAPPYAELARLLIEDHARSRTFVPRKTNAPYRIWGADFDDSACSR